jgi:hypothetical protein
MADSLMRAGTETAAIVPEVWSRKSYDVLLENLPFKSLIDSSYEGDISDLGDTVHIHTFPEFDEGTDLAEDGTADAESVTITDQTLIINKRVVKDFILTRRAQIQSLPMMDKLRDLAAFAIMKKVNSDIITDTVPSAATPDHQIAYDSGSTLALADILEAKELLDDQDVPVSDRHAVLGSAQMNDVFNISGFTSSDFLLARDAGAPLSSGSVPPLVGFEMNFASGVGNTSYWFHRSYMTIAVQDGMRVNIYDLGLQGSRANRVNSDLLFGIDQLDDTRVVTLS